MIRKTCGVVDGFLSTILLEGQKILNDNAPEYLKLKILGSLTSQRRWYNSNQILSALKLTFRTVERLLVIHCLVTFETEKV